MTCVAVMRLFAGAREAAGVARDSVDGRTLGDVLVAAREKYGADFGAILDTCRVWVNGDEAPLSTVLKAGDEVAVLPPVSGGACP
jgi:molybdopterin converting factor small subunit